MQLTSIHECRLGQIVYHPIYGEGKIFNITEGYIMVSFKGYKKRKISGGVVSFITNDDNVFEGLFTEPVYICTRKEYSVTTYRSGRKEIKYKYHPINTDQ